MTKEALMEKFFDLKKTLKITTPEGKIFIGNPVGFTEGHDEDDGLATLYIETKNGGAYWFNEKDIATIETMDEFRGCKMMAEKKTLCPVCGKTDFGRTGYYDICFVCGWEDDPIQREDPDEDGGANRMTLNQARKAYTEGRTLLQDIMEEKDLDTRVQNESLMPEETPVISLKLNPDWDGTDAQLLTWLGYTYEKGTIFEQDYTAARALYEIAGRNGEPQAISNIGWLCQNGLGVEKNVEQAIMFYELAAKAGNTTAMVNLGNIYERGELGESDYKKCFKWYKKAAEGGDPEGLFNYANCYHNGHGVRKNYKKAFAMFKDLADDGNSDACFYVGLYYQEGNGVSQDYELARRYYRRGALDDNAYCYNQLGVMYGTGTGVKKDVLAAKDYYLEAARLGDALAYVNIGWCYETGEAGEVDLDKALEYYQKAKDMGEALADEHIDMVLDKLW